MKKVKIMLLSLALIAIVGGALAFKAKYVQDFCYTTAREIPGGGLTCQDEENNPLTCPTFADESTTEAGPQIYCTTDETNCAQNPECDLPVVSITDN